MSDDKSKFEPTLTNQKGVKLQIPHTPEGREFLEKLKTLLGGQELPFQPTCPVPSTDHPATIRAEAAPTAAKGTSYALDLRLEQEGWPPFN